MSPPGRPKGEYRSAQREGSPLNAQDAPAGDRRSGQHGARPRRSLATIDAELDRFAPHEGAPDELLATAEDVLERWIEARGETPTSETREGFRLLALHRQGARGTPSFNACRETCREIAYHYNLLCLSSADGSAQRQRMMAMLVRHLALFVAGKIESEHLGEFCCASRPLRAEA